MNGQLSGTPKQCKVLEAPWLKTLCQVMTQCTNKHGAPGHKRQQRRTVSFEVGSELKTLESNSWEARSSFGRITETKPGKTVFPAPHLWSFLLNWRYWTVNIFWYDKKSLVEQLFFDLGPDGLPEVWWMDKESSGWGNSTDRFVGYSPTFYVPGFGW